MNYQTYIKEALPKSKVIEPSTEPGTITMWHGGNLDDYEDYIVHRAGRSQNGAGLYLTSNWMIANSYAKGSRKIYQVVVRKGTDITEVSLDWYRCSGLLSDVGVKTRMKENLPRFQKHIDEDGTIPASVFNNIIINEELILPKNLNRLRSFLVESGVDYELNRFRGYPMLVLFNMKKIVSVTRVMPKDKIVEFDLPGRFVE